MFLLEECFHEKKIGNATSPFSDFSWVNYLAYQKRYLSSVIEQIVLNKISSICPKICLKLLKKHSSF